MFLIVHLNHSPGILPRPDDPAIPCLDSSITPDDGERDFGHDFAVLGDRFVVVEFVARGFEDLDLVVVDVGEDLFC